MTKPSAPDLPHTVPVLGPDFNDTFARYSSRISRTWEEWSKNKLANPLELIGYDKPFKGGTNYAGFNHAHLGDDISVVYKLEGQNPRKLKLYGFYSHEDLGTGTPPKLKLQVKMAKRLKSQVFERKPR